jgi:hypothetical protein
MHDHDFLDLRCELAGLIREGSLRAMGGELACGLAGMNVTLEEGTLADLL